MDDLRQKIIDSLSCNKHGDSSFINFISSLVNEEGEHVYNTLLNVLTHLDFSPEDAKKNWLRIIENKKDLEGKLGHPVSLMTAVCYYFGDVEKNISAPAIIELEVLEKTKKQSFSDGLTGLFIRRYFDEAIQGEINRAQRYGSAFSVFFMDLDHFKKVNDAYGHQAGDLALKVVAKIIQNMKRIEDTACRYGGEEFILIFPETEKIDALVVAERIRKKVEEQVIEIEGAAFGVTLSGGIASYPVDGKEAHELVRAADIALFQAKKGGRNRIFIHDFEKRHYLRIDFDSEAQISATKNVKSKELDVQAKNVSSSGILFESPVAFEVGDQVQILLSIKDRGQLMTVKAQVVRVEKFDSHFDIGASFFEIGNPAGSELAKALAQNLGVPLDKIKGRETS